LSSGVKLSSTYNIVVNVLNDQPEFVGADLLGYLPSSTTLSIPFNEPQSFDLKRYTDTEGHAITNGGGVLCEIISTHTFSISISNWKVTIFTAAYSDLN
jgi:hypothetical protein